MRVTPFPVVRPVASPLGRMTVYGSQPASDGRYVHRVTPSKHSAA